MRVKWKCVRLYVRIMLDQTLLNVDCSNLDDRSHCVYSRVPVVFKWVFCRVTFVSPSYPRRVTVVSQPWRNRDAVVTVVTQSGHSRDTVGTQSAHSQHTVVTQSEHSRDTVETQSEHSRDLWLCERGFKPQSHQGYAHPDRSTLTNFIWACWKPGQIMFLWSPLNNWTTMF